MWWCWMTDDVRGMDTGGEMNRMEHDARRFEKQNAVNFICKKSLER